MNTKGDTLKRLIVNKVCDECQSERTNSISPSCRRDKEHSTKIKAQNSETRIEQCKTVFLLIGNRSYIGVENLWKSLWRYLMHADEK